MNQIKSLATDQSQTWHHLFINLWRLPWCHRCPHIGISMFRMCIPSHSLSSTHSSGIEGTLASCPGVLTVARLYLLSHSRSTGQINPLTNVTENCMLYRETLSNITWVIWMHALCCNLSVFMESHCPLAHCLLSAVLLEHWALNDTIRWLFKWLTSFWSRPEISLPGQHLSTVNIQFS